jgi:hypothetical protein
MRSWWGTSTSSWAEESTCNMSSTVVHYERSVRVSDCCLRKVWRYQRGNQKP